MFAEGDFDERFCPLRITPDNAGCYPDVNAGGLPPLGLCTVSQGQRSPCEYAYSAYCPLLRHNDFCDRAWAIDGNSRELTPWEIKRLS